MDTNFGRTTQFEGKDFLTKAQLAELLGIADRTIEERVERRYIQRIKLRKHRRRFRRLFWRR